MPERAGLVGFKQINFGCFPKSFRFILEGWNIQKDVGLLCHLKALKKHRNKYVSSQHSHQLKHQQGSETPNFVATMDANLQGEGGGAQTDNPNP